MFLLSSFKMSQISKRGYTEESLKEAIQESKEKKLSIRKISEIYRIPRSTLQDKLTGKLPEGVAKSGPSTVLTAAEEERIVDWCTKLSKCGFPLCSRDLIDTVQKIVNDDHRKTPFKEGRPGKTWLSLFLKRHPEIAFRTPEAITK